MNDIDWTKYHLLKVRQLKETPKSLLLRWVLLAAFLTIVASAVLMCGMVRADGREELCCPPCPAGADVSALERERDDLASKVRACQSALRPCDSCCGDHVRDTTQKVCPECEDCGGGAVVTPPSSSGLDTQRDDDGSQSAAPPLQDCCTDLTCIVDHPHCYTSTDSKVGAAPEPGTRRAERTGEVATLAGAAPTTDTTESGAFRGTPGADSAGGGKEPVPSLSTGGQSTAPVQRWLILAAAGPRLDDPGYYLSIGGARYRPGKRLIMFGPELIYTHGDRESVTAYRDKHPGTDEYGGNDYEPNGTREVGDESRLYGGVRAAWICK